MNNASTSMIGAYGNWAASLVPTGPGTHSWRNSTWTQLETWRIAARNHLLDLLAQPDTGGFPEVTVIAQSEFDGLHIEHLQWQLPFGPPSEAIFLKPLNADAPLPGVLALHDHGGNKYFGKRKIVHTEATQHPMMHDHQLRYYSGLAWANELAKRGYAVLVPDTFPFASRRVLLQDVPDVIRGELTDDNPEEEDNILAYNRWAADHESIMAKSLFCAGTTWPGVYVAEDQRALDVLCSRPDVDPTRVGCGGLSGGGMRTVYLGGIDDRVQCAVCVGLMSTWRDFMLNKSHTHTWMIYTPRLPQAMDFPEILGLRVPKPTLVLNNREDQLFTLPEMKRAAAILAEVYAKAGAESAYRASFYPGPHKFDQAMQTEAFAWFDQWLKAD